jgi:hypothetical protein
MQAKYPKIQVVDIRYGLGKPAESFSMAQDLVNKYRGQLGAIVAPTVVALPKVAEAVEQAGLSGKIVVTGMSTPNDMKEFVKRGTVKTVVLWNPGQRVESPPPHNLEASPRRKRPLCSATEFIEELKGVDLDVFRTALGLDADQIGRAGED